MTLNGIALSCWLRLVLTGLVCALLLSCSEPAEPLGKYQAHASRVGVSGISSGAYMAGQYHFAHSTSVIGSGIVAGGPYGCAESVLGRAAPVWSVALAQNLNRAINGCTGTSMALLGVPSVSRLTRRLRERATDKAIDPLSGLKTDRVFLFTGKEDRVVSPSLVRAAARLYEEAGVPKPSIRLHDSLNAGHGFATMEAGGSCDASGRPYIVDCDFDLAGTLLAHIHGPLKTPTGQPNGRLFTFAQREFSGNGLAATGAVFVPDDCRTSPGCAIHVAFHGCDQNEETVGDAFTAGAGYNRWAADNRLIVLYPQTEKSATNPQGCWDWWGYTGPDFLTKKASQIQAVHAMVKRLGAGPSP